MKIQAQPCFPAVPSIPEIAAARRPENAPAKEDAEKKIEILFNGRT